MKGSNEKGRGDSEGARTGIQDGKTRQMATSMTYLKAESGQLIKDGAIQ